MMPSQLTLFTTVVWVSISLNPLYMCLGQNTYYVSSATDSACPSTPCHNFSQYIQNSETYFTSNTTFIFSPGDHIVEAKVLIANVSTLKLIGSNLRISSRILCTLPAGFALRNVSNSEFTALEFISCGLQSFPFSAILLNQSNNFTFINCSFQSSKNTAMRAFKSTVVLTGNNFTNNSANQHGGGIFAVSSNVYLQRKNIFAYNTAQTFGGAIAMNSLSTFIITGSAVFINNVARFGGGICIMNSTAVFTFISCGMQGFPFLATLLNQTDNFKFTDCNFQSNKNTVFNSTVALAGNFTNNSADYGGGIVAFHSHVYVPGNNLFAYNSATEGGAIAVVLSTFNSTGKSVFMNNVATLGAGIHVINSTAVFVGESYFAKNTASHGSMIYVQDGTLLLTANQKFFKNLAFSHGGIFIRNAQMYMHGQSDFVNNTSPYGAGSSIWGLDCALNITGNINFISNLAYVAGPLTVARCNVSFNGNNTFYDNSAVTYGAVSILNSSVIFEGSTLFTNNHALHLSGTINTLSSNVTFLGSVSFVGNVANQSGSAAIFASHGNIFFDGKATFINNECRIGAAAYLAFVTVIFKTKSLFINNKAELHGGALYIVNSHLFFMGEFLFTGNNAGIGGAIAAANSSLTCTNSGTFVNNSAIEGGGLSLEHESRFEFLLRVIITFSNNTARRGGAIHVRDNVQSIECTNDPLLNFATSIATNPLQCFFGIVNNETNGLDYKPLWFEGNMAREGGSALYGGRLDKCELNPPLLNEYGNTSLSVFHTLSEFQTNTSNTSLISSAPFRVCFCEEDKPNCTKRLPVFAVRRGETFTVTIAALDQANETIPAVIRSYISSSLGIHTHLRRGNSLQQTGRGCTELHYQVFSEDESQELILYAEGPCHDVGEAQKSVHLTFRPCPVGFQLSEGECVCDRQLQNFTTECNIEDATVTRSSNFWMSPYYSENDTYIGLLLHPHCPFDYCVMGTSNISPSNPDSLCAHNRSGILCGACQQNFSLALGSSRCLKCGSAYLSLIIPLALFGIALVIFLFILKLTVAIGTINALIFYANVITVNRSSFFPAGETNILTIFIAWLNLDLGIETCFYDGMDAYAQVWLQFVFPVYIWTLVGLIILASSLSMRLAKLFGTNPVSVLATLFLLSYAKMLRTIITIMCFTILDYPDGSQIAVWLYDGNITYLTSKHIPLFITALIALLFFFLPYTFLLLLGQWLSPISNVKGFSWLNNTKFKSFMDAYHAPYTAKCRYWTGLLLLVRLGLFLAFAFNALGESSVNLLVITSTTLGLAMWFILVDRIYSNWYLNTLEFSFILNLGILSLATLYIGGTGGSQVAATYLSVSIAFVAFFGVLFYHIHLQLKGTKAWKILGKFHCIRFKGESKTQSSTQRADSGTQPMTVTTTFVELPKSGDSGDHPLTTLPTNSVQLRESMLSD